MDKTGTHKIDKEQEEELVSLAEGFLLSIKYRQQSMGQLNIDMPAAQKYLKTDNEKEKMFRLL